MKTITTNHAKYTKRGLFGAASLWLSSFVCFVCLVVTQSFP